VLSPRFVTPSGSLEHVCGASPSRVSGPFRELNGVSLLDVESRKNLGILLGAVSALEDDRRPDAPDADVVLIEELSRELSRGDSPCSDGRAPRGIKDVVRY